MGWREYWSLVFRKNKEGKVIKISYKTNNINDNRREEYINENIEFFKDTFLYSGDAMKALRAAKKNINILKDTQKRDEWNKKISNIESIIDKLADESNGIVSFDFDDKPQKNYLRVIK